MQVADGEKSKVEVYTLNVSTNGVDSGLVDTATNETVVLSLNTVTGNIEGKTANSGDVVFSCQY